jgi:hypothetical protein
MHSARTLPGASSTWSWPGSVDRLGRKRGSSGPALELGVALITATYQATIDLTSFDGVIITEIRTVIEARAAILYFVAVMVENPEPDDPGGTGVIFLGLAPTRRRVDLVR